MDAWTTRTHGLICTPVDGRPALTLPTRVYTGWCIGSVFGLDRSSVSHLRDTVRSSSETWTHRDSNPGHPPCKGGTLPLSYGPTSAHEGGQGSDMLALVVQRCPIGQTLVDRTWTAKVGWGIAPVPVCGGDPAADSPTATLLRLKPPCGAQIRPTLRRPHPDPTRVL